MMRMTLLAYILLQHFVSNLVFAFSLIHNSQDDITLIGRQLTQLSV